MVPHGNVLRIRPQQHPNNKRKRTGGMTYDALDAPFLAEMAKMIDDGTADSEWQAATMLHDRAAGSPHGESRAKRLLLNFQKRSALNGL